MHADAWATALLVLGPDVGYDVAARHGLAALFVSHAGGEFVEKATPAFDELVERQPQPLSRTAVFIAAFAAFAVAMVAMALGVLISNRRLKGTCGGLAALRGSDGADASGELADFGVIP